MSLTAHALQTKKLLSRSLTISASVPVLPAGLAKPTRSSGLDTPALDGFFDVISVAKRPGASALTRTPIFRSKFSSWANIDERWLAAAGILLLVSAFAVAQERQFGDTARTFGGIVCVVTLGEAYLARYGCNVDD